MDDPHQEPRRLAPLPYHSALCDCLQLEEPALWQWFSSDRYSEELIEAQKLELLKTTVRLHPESHTGLYVLATQARNALDMELPITLYQAQAGDGANAMLYFLPDSIAIVLQGDWVEQHSEQEICSVFGHEIAHHKLYAEDGGRYFIGMRILSWCQQQPDCPPAFFESARRYQLFTEIYADLGSLVVTGEWQSTVSSLIKMSTGLKQVSVHDYVAQADEVLAKYSQGSSASSHPETYLRTKIMHSLHQQAGDWQALNWQQEVQRLIVGQLDICSLDLLDQQRLTEASAQLIALMTQDSVMRSDTLEALAQEYFPEFQWSANDVTPPTDTLSAVLQDCTDKTRTYLCYLLLDFASADPDIQPDSYIRALKLADQLALITHVEPLFRKELKMKKDQVAQLLASAQGRHDHV